MWIQFFRPRVTGRIEFSTRLLLNSSSGYKPFCEHIGKQECSWHQECNYSYVKRVESARCDRVDCQIRQPEAECSNACERKS
jgi:hypothetical protein